MNTCSNVCGVSKSNNFYFLPDDQDSVDGSLICPTTEEALEADNQFGDSFSEEWEPMERCNSHDIFTELDPLGPGRPFIDKKDFFSDVRKQTKRVLREMSSEVPGDERRNTDTGSNVIPTDVSALVASTTLYSHAQHLASTDSSSCQGNTATTLMHHKAIVSHHEDDFFHTRFDADNFADFNRVTTDSPLSDRSELSSCSIPEEVISIDPAPIAVPHIPITLPPESFRDTPKFPPKHLERQCSVNSCTSQNSLPNQHNRDVWSTYRISSQFETSAIHSNSQPDILNESRSEERNYFSDDPLSRGNSGELVSADNRSTDNFQDGRFSPPCGAFPNDCDSDFAPSRPPRSGVITEPPPLPPKRQPSNVTLKPPRPPTSSTEGIYIGPDISNNLSQISSTQSFGDSGQWSNSSVPPIPLPSRKTTTSRTNKNIYPKPKQPLPIDQYEDLPKLIPNESAPVKTSTPASKSPRSVRMSPPIRPRVSPPMRPIDLTKLSLDELASKLKMPVSKLAKLTVFELAACFAKMQLDEKNYDSHNMYDDASDEYITTDDVRSNNGSFGDDFSANFDNKFPTTEHGNTTEELDISNNRFTDSFNPKFPVSVDSAEEELSIHSVPPEDRYAVFRELESKTKTVFDDNFLTPQNSVDDDLSEVTSATFKVDFPVCNMNQDSMERNSNSNLPVLNSSSIGNVFKSPDISEYENFEVNFDGKFCDDFSGSEIQSQYSLDAIDIPTQHSFDAVTNLSLDPPTPRSFERTSSTRNERNCSESSKSPFVDDFSRAPREEILKKINASKSSTESLGKFEDDFMPQVEDKYAIFRELVLVAGKNYPEVCSRSPFEANDPAVQDSGFMSTTEADKFDDVFQDTETVKGKIELEARDSTMLPDNDSLNNKSPFEEELHEQRDRYEVLDEVESEPSVEVEAAPNKSPATPDLLFSTIPEDASISENISWIDMPTPITTSVIGCSKFARRAASMDQTGCNMSPVIPHIRTSTSLDISEEFKENNLSQRDIISLSRQERIESSDGENQARSSSVNCKESCSSLKGSDFEDNFVPASFVDSSYKIDSMNQLNAETRCSTYSLRGSDFEDNFVPEAFADTFESPRVVKSQNDSFGGDSFADFDAAFDDAESVPSSGVFGDFEDDPFPSTHVEFKVSAGFTRSPQTVYEDMFNEEVFPAEYPAEFRSAEFLGDNLNPVPTDWEKSFEAFNLNMERQEGK